MAHDTTISMALNALHLTSTECLKNAYENKTTENCITAVNKIILITSFSTHYLPQTSFSNCGKTKINRHI